MGEKASAQSALVDPLPSSAFFVTPKNWISLENFVNRAVHPVTKTADSTPINASETLFEEPTWTALIPADVDAVVEGVAIYTAHEDADFNFKISCTNLTGDTGWRAGDADGDLVPLNTSWKTAGETAFAGTGTDPYTPRALRFFALIRTVTNPGDLSFSWSQWTSHASDTTLLQGSYFRIIRGF